MKKFVLSTALAGGLMLSGCAGLTPTSVGSITTTLLSEVEKIVATTCSAIPEAASIIALLNAGVAASASALAASFCGAFQTALPAPAPAAKPALKAARFGLARASMGYYCNGAICGWK